MKLPLSWLREFVDVDIPPAQLASRITDAIAEVEGWQTIGGDWDPALIRVAEVVAVEPHPNADRLRLATVETGAGRQQVVCGAPNVAPGQKVAFATEGAILIDGHTGKPSRLKLRPIRGVESAGMVLSEKELGLSEEHEGILVLPADAAVGRSLVEQLGDIVFDISTWANRADLLGVLGLAREVAAITGATLREPDRAHGQSDSKVEDFVSVSIEDPDLCRRFTASIIEGVEIGPSPEWMQQRLIRMGMRPINNVVDITNYVMLETGQPLHTFDYDRVRGKRIVARRAKPGERLITLDGVDRELDPNMLMICDGEGAVGIAGIMGGGNTEVSDSTTTVLLEVANFHPGSIRRSSMLLKLRSEASLRFEKGIGADMAEYVQHRALHLFEQITGGRVAAGLVDVYPGKQPPRTIVLTEQRIEQVLGISIPTPDVRRILGALGFHCQHVRPDRYSIQPPFWRTDIEIPDDIIEDLGRVYGYDKLPTTMLGGSLPPVEERPVVDVRERVRDTAVALGFYEVISYTLTAMRQLERVVDPDDTLRLNPLGVVNPVAAQHTYLRTSIRGSVLESFAANRNNVTGPLRLFEIGSEYLPVEADLPHERPVFCAVLGGAREVRWPGATGDPLDFFDAKGTLEAVLGELGVAFKLQSATHFGLLEGHTADILTGRDPVGVVAQVAPRVAAAFDIDQPVFLVELWLEDLARHVPDRPAYAPLPRHPAARVDLAVLVDESTPAGAVLDLVRSHRSRDVTVTADVFDEYRGEGLPQGKKSLALNVRFQSGERTLDEKDVARVRESLLSRLEKELGATLRGA